MNVLACALLLLQASAVSHGLPLTGEPAEDFLRTARVVSMRELSVGISGPRQATLSDGRLTGKAVWKTIDYYRPGLTYLSKGQPEIDFRDSYRSEVAAYELDKLLGLDLVPPTVERTVGRETGAMQMWVERVVTEYERRERGLLAPDPEGWDAQMDKVRLLRQLTYDSDRANIRNLLIDPADFRIYAIDFSRAFRRYSNLPAPEELTRFPRAVLERLRGLNEEVIDRNLGTWVPPTERRALLKRRDAILAIADRLVAQKGAVAVLHP